MAKGWDKIKDKIEGGADAPRSADWEAMNAKIQAYPALNSSSALAFHKLWIAVSLLLVGAASWWYFTDFSHDQNISNVPVQYPLKVRSGDDNNEIYEAEINKPAGAQPEKTKELAKKEELTPSLANPTTPAKTEKPRTQANDLNIAAATEVTALEEQSEFDDDKAKHILEAEKPLPVQENILESKMEQSKELPVLNRDFSEVELQPEISEKPESSQDSSVAEQSSSDSLTLEYREATEKADSSAFAAKPESMPELASAEADDFYNANSGFKLRSVQIGGKYLNNFNNQQGWQLGGDVTLGSNNWLLNAGLYYGQDQRKFDEVAFREELQIDSSFTQQITSRNVQEIRSYWVIDSFFAGHWENDTVVVTVTDTAQILNIDTIRFKLRQVNERMVHTSYVEMPILAGYEFPINRFSLQIMGGVILNQTITVGAEAASTERFGLSGVVQPALHYSFSSGYSAYIRSGMRYALKPNASLRTQSFYYDIQLGIAIEW